MRYKTLSKNETDSTVQEEDDLDSVIKQMYTSKRQKFTNIS